MDEMREYLEQAMLAAFGIAPEGSAARPAEGAASAGELQLAAAVLCLQAALADHQVRLDEQRTLRPALRRALGLQEAQLDALLRLAEQDAAERPLHELCRQLGAWPLDARKKLVHGMWRVVLADAELEAHEEYVVRKTAELLGLSRADLIETKLRAREEFLAEEL